MNKWYNSQGNNSDVVLSSKIRLARNMSDAPFPCRMSSELRKSACRKIYAALKNSSLAGDVDMIDLSQKSDVEKISLAERGIISPELAKSKENSAVVVSRDEALSIMLCEEDHIRLCVMSAGQSLDEAYKKADEVDNIFIESLNIAFDERLGFLTSNPMNIGTGLKASLILHLPAIKQKGMIPSLTAMVGKLGFGIKHIFGGYGDFYELSNRLSLGITEKSAIENLNAICDQIVKQERAYRRELIEYDDFEDKIFRAMGTLKMARKLTVKEFYKFISLVRMGISAGSFEEKYEAIGDMLYSLGTATLLCNSQEGMTIDEADKLRAQYVREKLGG